LQCYWSVWNLSRFKSIIESAQKNFEQLQDKHSAESRTTIDWNVLRYCTNLYARQTAGSSRYFEVNATSRTKRSQWYKLTLTHINPHELSTDNSYNVMIFRKINRIGHVNGTVYRLRRDAPSSVKAWLMRSPLWFIANHGTYTTCFSKVYCSPRLLGRWNFLRYACNCSTSDVRISAFTSRVSTFRAYCFLRILDVHLAPFLYLFVREHARSGGSVIRTLCSIWFCIRFLVARTLKPT